MEYIFQLSGENLALAKEEVLSLISTKSYKPVKNLLIVNTKNINKLESRLAYTHRIYQLFFSANKKDLIKKLSNFNWQSIYRKNFSLRIINLTNKETNYNEAELAGYIWRSVKNPKVNLEKAETQIVLFANKKVHCCRLLKEIDKDFLKRKPQFRPGFMPTSLNPRLARAIVNLTGIKNGTVVDPFCGTGGLLIEAGLMGFKVIGYDIDSSALEKCRQNLDFYKIKNYGLENRDATRIKGKFNYVVTDLPYGRNTRLNTPLDDLYLQFLINLKKTLKKKAVVIFPHFVNYRKLIKQAKLRIRKEFSHYIHKSLTKKIILLG